MASSNPFTPRSLSDLAADWPKDLDHISASSVKMIARCPRSEQFRRRYMLGEKIPPAAALIAGSADHAAIERTMRQKITSYTDLPTNEVVDAFYEKFEEDVDFWGVKEIEVKDRSGPVTAKAAKVKFLDNLKVEAADLVKVYHTTISPTVQPTAVEEEFEFNAPNLPVKVEGRIDLVAKKDDEYMIDRKRTGGGSPTKPSPEWTIQADVYQLVRPVPHAWHVSSVKTRNISELWQPVRPKSITETQLEHLCGEIGYFYMRYGPHEPWPARGRLHTWACSYCGFRPDCWAWRT